MHLLKIWLTNTRDQFCTLHLTIIRQKHLEKKSNVSEGRKVLRRCPVVSSNKNRYSGPITSERNGAVVEPTGPLGSEVASRHVPTSRSTRGNPVRDSSRREV
jgi:hypothetical protein